jgi:hypothetical protein
MTHTNTMPDQPVRLSNAEKAKLVHLAARALRDTIVVHGPIDRHFAMSAAKRVVGQMVSYLEHRDTQT